MRGLLLLPMTLLGACAPPSPTGFLAARAADDFDTLVLVWEAPRDGYDALVVEAEVDGVASSLRITRQQLLGPLQSAPPTSLRLGAPADAGELSHLVVRLSAEQGGRRSAPAEATIAPALRPASDVQAFGFELSGGGQLVTWTRGSKVAEAFRIDRRLHTRLGALVPLEPVRDGPPELQFWQDVDPVHWLEGARIDFCVVYTLGELASVPACALGGPGPPLAPAPFTAVARGPRVALDWTPRSEVADVLAVSRSSGDGFFEEPLFVLDAGATGMVDVPPPGVWHYRVDALWRQPGGNTLVGRSAPAVVAVDEPAWDGGLHASIVWAPPAAAVRRTAAGGFDTATGGDPFRRAWLAAGTDAGWVVGATGSPFGFLAGSLVERGGRSRALWADLPDDGPAILHQVSFDGAAWTDEVVMTDGPRTLPWAVAALDGRGAYVLASPPVPGPTMLIFERADGGWSTEAADDSIGDPLALVVDAVGVRLLFERPDVSLGLGSRLADAGWTTEEVPAEPVALRGGTAARLFALPGRLVAFQVGRTVVKVMERTAAGWSAPLTLATRAPQDSWGWAASASADASRLAVAVTGQGSPQLLLQEGGAWRHLPLFASSWPEVGFTSDGKAWVLTGLVPRIAPTPPEGAPELRPYALYEEQ